MRILLIEDDPEASGFLRKGLEEAGHVVDHAGDGNQGLLLALDEEHDVIVVDRMLPGLDGLSIVRSLRAADRNTPVLVLSALGEVDDRWRACAQAATTISSSPSCSPSSRPGSKRWRGGGAALGTVERHR